MGQRVAATGVKFRPGSPSTLGEKVTCGLVWRFGTFDCVSDNLDCFEDGVGDSGLIRLKRIYNFLGFMLVFTPFA
jgi:hypothetical protein